MKKHISVTLIGMTVFGLLWTADLAVGGISYGEKIEEARGNGRPSNAKKEDENPVMVQYQVGDTSDFYTHKAKESKENSSSEWDQWDGEEE